MKAFVVFAALVAAASANPQLLVNNLGLLGGSAITYSGVPYATGPVVSQAIVAPIATKTQYHAQDELGQASYGYAHPGQAHAAVRDAAGNVRGSYAYINPEGKEIRVEYVADGAGFRVASNALPVSPVAPGLQVAPQLIAPLPVQDTPEVIQARAAHLQAHALARSRTKRGVAVLPSALGYSSLINHPIAYNTVASPLLTSAVHGYSNQIIAAPALTGYSSQVLAAPALTGYSSQVLAAPALAYSAPVVAAQPLRQATLTKVVNTPGHAVSYRVD